MAIYDILGIAGTAVLVIGVVFVALAAFVFFKGDVRGAQDVLSGKKVAQEVEKIQKSEGKKRRHGATPALSGPLSGDFSGSANARSTGGFAKAEPMAEAPAEQAAPELQTASEAAPVEAAPAPAPSEPEPFDPDAPTTTLGEVAPAAPAAAPQPMTPSPAAVQVDGGFCIVRKLVLRESKQVIEG